MEQLVEHEKIDQLLDTANDVSDYLDFDAVLSLGLQVHHSEVPFDKVMLFSWIKEEIKNGREHRVSTQSNRR